jgi:hypothetical protein
MILKQRESGITGLLSAGGRGGSNPQTRAMREEQDIARVFK